MRLTSDERRFLKVEINRLSRLRARRMALIENKMEYLKEEFHTIGKTYGTGCRCRECLNKEALKQVERRRRAKAKDNATS